jgi:penicillin amidase
LSTIFPEISEALNPPPVSMGGGLDTPQAAGHSPMGPYDIAGTSVARYVFDLADWENSRWIVPLGSSGHPGSPHYADQATTWANVELINMAYDWDGIRKEAVTSQVLSNQG